MIHRRLYCYAVLREFACSCKTRKPNIGIDTESHIGYSMPAIGHRSVMMPLRMLAGVE
jgi:hypothetical protein